MHGKSLRCYQDKIGDCISVIEFSKNLVKTKDDVNDREDVRLQAVERFLQKRKTKDCDQGSKPFDFDPEGSNFQTFTTIVAERLKLNNIVQGQKSITEFVNDLKLQAQFCEQLLRLFHNRQHEQTYPFGEHCFPKNRIQ